MDFRKLKQALRRKTSKKFQRLLDEIGARLERHGVCYPPWFTPDSPFFFKKQLKEQDVLATWFDFLSWRLRLQETGQEFLDKLRPSYESDANELLTWLGEDGGDIETLERSYGSMSVSFIANLMYKRRRMVEKDHGGPGSQEIEAIIRERDNHWDQVAEFQHKTNTYRTLRIHIWLASGSIWTGHKNRWPPS